MLAVDPKSRIATAEETRTELARLRRWIGLGAERRARYADAVRVVHLAGENEERSASLAALADKLGIRAAEAREIEESVRG